jgi:hypothetical protein
MLNFGFWILNGREEARRLRHCSFSLPENFKLNTSNFFHILPLQRQSPGRRTDFGFSARRPFFNQNSPLLMRFLIPLILTSATLHAALPTAPTGLLTNGIVNPQAIDLSAPSFSWIMNDTDRGETQTSYQILVSSNSSHTGDVWNSGKDRPPNPPPYPTPAPPSPPPPATGGR